MNNNKVALTVLYVSLPVFIYSMTPNERLLESSYFGDRQQVKEALAAGADINYTNSNSIALHLAARKRHTDIVKFLLKSNAAVDSKDYYGFTPLHDIARRSLTKAGNYTEIAELLIAAGADVNAQAHDGTTPLHKAVLNGRMDVARSLIENGADRYLKDNNGYTALDVAKIWRMREMIKLLIEVPPLKILSVRAVGRRIMQNELMLEQVETNLPKELYDLFGTYPQ